MTDWIAQLEVLDAQPLFPSEADATRDATIGIDVDLKHVSRPERRRMMHMLNVANAAKALDRLPDQGETFHVVMRGNYHGWDLVPAVLRLAAPATIRELNIATLGFSASNSSELIRLLDSGQVGRCSFICSVYYRSMKDGAPVYDALAQALTSRGHQICAIRSHCKIIAMEMDGGDCYVIESSANLRSCRNLEQFTMSNDRALLEFHRGWQTTLGSGLPWAGDAC